MDCIVKIENLTKGNAAEKYGILARTLAKSLGLDAQICGCAECENPPQEISLEISGIDGKNGREKYAEAMSKVAKAMGAKAEIEAERFLWPCQDELFESLCSRWNEMTAEIYEALCDALGLPKVSAETEN